MSDCAAIARDGTPHDDPRDLGNYLWNEKVLNNYFCRTCGIFTYIADGENGKDGYRVNLGCVDEIDDPLALGTLRCQNNVDQIPWSYATADQGHVGKYVTLTAATGAISQLETGVLPSCNGTRHVACCSTIVAP